MNARSRESEPPQTPQSFPDTLPAFPGKTYDITVQMVFELKESVGRLMHAVESLEKNVEKHDDKIDHLSKRMYAAGVLIAILSPIVLLILDKIFPLISAALRR